MAHQIYAKRGRKRALFLVLLIVLFLLLFITSLFAGSDGVKLSDIDKLFSKNDEIFIEIFYTIRVPRAVAAVVYGAILAVSGAVMQAVLRNPLASPFTLGISQSAGFGAAVSIVIFPIVGITNPFLLQFGTAFLAFIFSVIAILIILLLSIKAKMSSVAIILSGVAIGSLFGSLTMFLQYITDEISAAATLFWTFGDLSRASADLMAFSALFATVSFIYFWINHWKFDLFALGDEIAFNKGVKVGTFRAVALIVATIATASSVAFFGIIGFVGLIAPHIVRIIIGSAHAFLLPASAFLGASLLMLADLLAKFALYPAQLPVGILTSFVGAPMLLYILIIVSKRTK